MTGRRARIALLVAVFAASGAAGLFAEQCFEKLLGTLLGTGTNASAVVLATYFAGLTIGGAGYARVRRRLRTPRRALAAYALLEITAALACLVLSAGCATLVPRFAPLLELTRSSAPLLVVMRVIVAAAWLLPVTVPMGATFPAIVDGIAGVAAKQTGSIVSAFYAANLAGAIVAASLGPYLVIPRAGLDGTLAIAAGLDLVAAATALEAACRMRRDAPPLRDAAGAAPITGSFAPALVLSALSGAVLFSLEVTWTHLVATVIGNSVFAFALMLALVLTALGLGAAAAGLVAARLRRMSVAVPGAALVVASLVLTIGHARWPEVPHALAGAGAAAASFADAEIARATLAAWLLVPPASVLGAVYPLLLRLDVVPEGGAGGLFARMSAANAVGAIAGALLTSFAAIPRLGAERTLHALSIACLLAGAAAVMRGSGARWTRVATLAVALGGSAAIVRAPRWDRLRLTSGEQVYLARSHVFPSSKLRFFHEDAHGGFTTVVENDVAARTRRVLLTNGKFQGNDDEEMAAQDGFVLAPVMFLRRFDDALVIGLGTGRSAFVTSALGFERVNVAEISAGIVAAARTEFGHVNGDLFARPGVSLTLDDARNHLLVSRDTYDLITMEVTSIWFSGASNLYSREFYELCRRRLRRHGALSQWLQLHHLGLDEVASVIGTMRAVFAHVSLFVIGGQGVLVATDHVQETRPEPVERLERHAHLLGAAIDARALAARVRAARLLSPEDVDRMLAATRPRLNTDANRFIEYATPRHATDRVPPGSLERRLAEWSSRAPGD